MILWAIIIAGSAAVGITAAMKLSGNAVFVAAGAIPWLGVVVALVLISALFPSIRADGGFWAQGVLGGGTAAAAAGVVSACAANVVREIFKDGA